MIAGALNSADLVRLRLSGSEVCPLTDPSVVTRDDHDNTERIPVSGAAMSLLPEILVMACISGGCYVGKVAVGGKTDG